MCLVLVLLSLKGATMRLVLVLLPLYSPVMHWRRVQTDDSPAGLSVRLPKSPCRGLEHQAHTVPPPHMRSPPHTPARRGPAA